MKSVWSAVIKQEGKMERCQKIFAAKKVAGSDEENRHVKQVNDMHQKAGAFSVTYHHQYDGNALANGNNVVAHERRCLISTTKVTQYPHLSK